MDPLQRVVKNVSRAFEDGFVVKIHPNGTYDVLVGGRDFPYEGVGPIGTDKQFNKSIGDSARIGFIGGNPQLPFMFPRGSAPQAVPGGNINSGHVIVPLEPKLWLQHDAFWWTPGRQRDPQNSMTIIPGSTQFLDTGEPQDAIDNALSFRGLVAFPQGDDQIIANLTAVYASAGFAVDNVTFNEEITFVEAGTENGETTQAPGRSFVLTYEPSPPLADDLSPSIVHTPPSDFNTTVLYPVALPRTYGLALAPVNYANVDYLYGPIVGTDYTDNFAGDGVTTDFHPYAPTSYVTSQGNTVAGPAAWINSLTSPPTVDGIPDLLATFFEGTVRLSFAPDPGAYIEIHTNTSFLNNYYDNVTGDGPEYALTVGTERAFYLLEASEASGAIVTDNVLLMEDKVVFLALWVEDDTVEFAYNHDVLGSELWNITKLRILEKNVTSGAIVTLDTPLSAPWQAHLKTLDDAHTPVVGNDIAKLGQLFYDPLTGTYTIAGPTGLIWRNRTADLEAAGGPHFTLTPWPATGFSQDGGYVEQGYNTVPRLPYPWYGVAAAGHFAMQSPWNRVGGAEKYPGYGDYSDTVGYLYLWKRNEENVWENHHTIDVTTLAQNPAAGTLNILGSCYTSLRSGNEGDGNNWAHVMSRNLVAWIVPCGWNVTGYSGETGVYSGGAGGGSPVGWKDAGLTLNAIDPTLGTILAQHTIKCDTDEIHYIYVDPMADINQQIADGPAYIASVIDKYVNNNPIYWPPTSGSVPAQPIIGFETFGAQPNFFEYPPGSGDAYFMVGRLTGLEEQGAQIRQLPSLPGFDPYGYALTALSSENPTRQINPQIITDELNNLYLYLYHSIWMTFGPELSDANGGVTQFVTGSVSHVHASNSTPQPLPLYEIVGTENLLISDGGDPPDGITSSNYGLVYAPSFPLSLSNEFRSVAWFYPVTYAGDSPPGTPTYTSPANTLNFTWKSYTFNPTFAGVTGTYTGLPRPIETLTLGGWIEVPQNYAGFITYDYVSDWTAQYFTTPKLILHKIHFDEAAKTFTEVWRKDVGERFPADPGADPPRNPGTGGDYPAAKAVAGRYIFNILPSPSDAYTASHLGLFAWTNGDTAPGTATKVIIPNSDRTNVGITEYYDMIADVNSDGHEIVTIWHIPPEASFLDPTHLYLTIVTFPTTGDPIIEQVEITPHSPPYFPNPNIGPMLKRMIRVNNSYYWDGADSKVYTKSAP